jgi:hypothetical protein
VLRPVADALGPAYRAGLAGGAPAAASAAAVALLCDGLRRDAAGLDVTAQVSYIYIY